MGYSRGGLSTKVHAAVDGLGDPIRFILTAGQSSECLQAEALITDLDAQYILGDKGYDMDALIGVIEANNGVAVIPPKQNRTIQRDYDKAIYKERNLVERFFSKDKKLSTDRNKI